MDGDDFTQPVSLRKQLVLEANQQSGVSNQVYDWSNDFGEIEIREGDEITVYQSFINVRGASSETIAILDNTINGENPTKTPIEIQFYKTNDGLNSLPMPFSFQLLSQGKEEMGLTEIDKCYRGEVGQGTLSLLGSGVYIQETCPRNLDIVDGNPKETHLSNYLEPIDCSRYTLMETYLGEEGVWPYVRHNIKTATHTFDLEDNYYTPQNLCDNLTKSLNNPEYSRIKDEFGSYSGINISSPALIRNKGLYRTRKYWGGNTINSWDEYKTGGYISKSVFGWDLTKSPINSLVGWYWNDGTTSAKINYAYPEASETWFSPSPSWDFYGKIGTGFYTEGEKYAVNSGSIEEHIDYYFKYPQSLIKGESLWSEIIRGVVGSDATLRGSTGTLITGWLWNENNINKIDDWVSQCLEEGCYDNLKIRNWNDAGTSTLDMNTNIHRAFSIGERQPDDVNFGTGFENTYLGFTTNRFGYPYGCDLGGYGSKSVVLTGTNADGKDLVGWNRLDEEDPVGSYSHSLNYSFGTYCPLIQLVHYDKTNTEGKGICYKVIHGGADHIAFKVGTSEGGFAYDTTAADNRIGWLPKFSDGICNAAICHINPNGLGSEDDRLIVGTDTGTNSMTTRLYPRDIAAGVNPTWLGTVVTKNDNLTKEPKGYSSANPEINVGAIYPQFNFDTGLSRFKISDLHTPQYIRNSVFATNTNEPVSQGGTAIAIFNPIFQQSCNQRIGAYANLTLTQGKKDNRALQTYINNADKNRNTILDKITIMDASMGIYISKWSNNDTEETWSNTLWNKMGFSYKSLHSSNNRNFRNENYVLGSNPSISNPVTTNANLDTQLMNQFSRNLYDLPIYNVNACGDVLQREILATSTDIISDDLPIKNFTPYYLICSDILNYGGIDEYRQSRNIIPAIDICSLNYNSSDYYYAEPSQLVHTCSKTTRISSINTVIRRPDGKLAEELSGASSIVYKISRAITNQGIETGDINELLPPIQDKGTALKAIGPALMEDRLANYNSLLSRGIMSYSGPSTDELDTIMNTIGKQEKIDELKAVADTREKIHEQLLAEARLEIARLKQQEERPLSPSEYELPPQAEEETEEELRTMELEEEVADIFDEVINQIEQNENTNVDENNIQSISQETQTESDILNNYNNATIRSNLEQQPEYDFRERTPAPLSVTHLDNLRKQLDVVSSSRQSITRITEKEKRVAQLQETLNNLRQEQNNFNQVNSGNIETSRIATPQLESNISNQTNNQTTNTVVNPQNIIDFSTEMPSQTVNALLDPNNTLTPPRPNQPTTPDQQRHRIYEHRQMDSDLDAYMGRTEQPVRRPQLRREGTKETQESMPVSHLSGPSATHQEHTTEEEGNIGE